MLNMAEVGSRVTITDKRHPHYGESGVLTDEFLKTTGQHIMTLDDCMHGTTNTAVTPEDFGEKSTPQSNPVGRPSEYAPETAAALCAELAQGKSLRTVCQIEGMPSGATVFKWMRENPEFLKQYDAAKQEASDAMAEDIVDISDDHDKDFYETDDGRIVPNSVAVQRARLRVDTRKWLMAKMKPKKYGDKLDLTSAGDKLPAPIFGGTAAEDGKAD